jgi:DnaK suppressor protein
MDKKLLIKLKEKLEKEKKETEKQLGKFANKDENLKGDWDTRFPCFNGKESGSASLEQAADEVQEYSNLLPVEHVLELKLKNIDSALKKIKLNKYGLCEKCQKKISNERLMAFPEAECCLNCKKT